MRWAGRVGMTMAAALKRFGIDVRIVDKSAARTDKSKALALWPWTLELMDIQGCLQGFLDAGMEGEGARILADGHELVHAPSDRPAAATASLCSFRKTRPSACWRRSCSAWA